MRDVIDRLYAQLFEFIDFKELSLMFCGTLIHSLFALQTSAKERKLNVKLYKNISLMYVTQHILNLFPICGNK